MHTMQQNMATAEKIIDNTPVTLPALEIPLVKPLFMAALLRAVATMPVTRGMTSITKSEAAKELL